MNRFSFSHDVASRYLPGVRGATLMTNLTYPAEHPHARDEYRVIGTLETQRRLCHCGWKAELSYRAAKSTQTFSDAGLLAWRRHLSDCPIALIYHLRRRGHLHRNVCVHIVGAFMNNQPHTEASLRAVGRAIARACRRGHLLLMESNLDVEEPHDPCTT